MPSVVGTFVAIKFIQLFSKPFKKWDAYRLGLIDEKGKKLRNAENQAERNEFVSWKNLIRKLKIILEKLPLGPFKGRLASLAASFWLLKEDLDSQGYNGEEIINILYERVLEDTPNLKIISENVNRPQILASGKYSITDTSTLLIVDDELHSIGECFGYPIFKLKDIITNTEYTFTTESLEKL